MINFTLDDVQRQMVNEARDFGKEVLEPAEIELDKYPCSEDIFTSDLFWNTLRKCFELGFHKMSLPERFGGLGLDAITIGLVWEELSRYAPGYAATLVASSVVPQMISVFASGNKELIKKYVEPFCESDDPKLISAWGSSEPNVGSDGKNYYDVNVKHSTKAVLKDKKYTINGAKSNFISNGGIANSCIVFACVNPEMGLRGSGAFLIPTDDPGFSKGTALEKIGLKVLNQTPIFFDDVNIPENYMIFPPGEGYPMLHNSIVTVGNLGTGYIAVGLLRAAYEEALAYSKERVQWGKPIFEHQLIAQKLHNAFTAIETARALLWKGSWLSKTKFPGDLKTSLTAKIYASNSAAHHTAEMMMVLGGYGISKDYTLEKYTRDAPLLQIMDGTNETLQMKAAALL